MLRHRKHLDKLLTRTGPFTDEDMFMVGEKAIDYLSGLKLLYVADISWRHVLN